MKTYKLKPNEQLFFVVPVDGAWKKTKHALDEKGNVVVEDSAIIATSSFMVADLVLTQFKETVFLVEDFDHGELVGAAITPELNRQLRYTYQEFRFTGKLNVKLPDVMNKFYLEATRVKQSFGFIALEELGDISKEVRFIRYHFKNEKNENKSVLVCNNENFVIHAESSLQIKEIPAVLFLIHKDNRPVLIARNMHPGCFESMEEEVQSIQITYSRPIVSYLSLPFVFIEKYDSFGDIIGTPTMMFFPSDETRHPPTLTEVLKMSQ